MKWPRSILRGRLLIAKRRHPAPKELRLAAASARRLAPGAGSPPRALRAAGRTLAEERRPAVVQLPAQLTDASGGELTKRRNAAGALSCNRILYGGKDSAPTYFAGTADERQACPTTANFALRARLSRFDTRDDAWDPRGLVVLIGLNREVGVTDSNSMGRALIK